MAKKDEKPVGFNIASFINGSEENKNLMVRDVVPVVETVPAKKASSKSKKSDALVPAGPLPVPQSSMSYIQENIPYQVAYTETNAQLDEAIQQLNMLGAETMMDLQMVRSSKTLRNKYNVVNDMTENAVSIINAKIAAIKEKNKTINDSNNAEIRRIKDLKMQNSQEDDNTHIANLYNAFVNTPIGTGGPNMLGPSMQDLTMVGGVPMMGRVDIGGDQAAWEASLDPASRRMTLMAQGKIETVVFYDSDTGNRWYEVVDKMTRQPVPNVEKPSENSLYDLNLDVNSGVAKDPNRNTIYPLIVVGSGANTINHY